MSAGGCVFLFPVPTQTKRETYEEARIEKGDVACEGGFEGWAELVWCAAEEVTGRPRS